jgi:hypothetical protein
VGYQIQGLLSANSGNSKDRFNILIRQTIMDELVNKLAGLGVAGLVLVGLVATSLYVGAVAITTS